MTDQPPSDPGPTFPVGGPGPTDPTQAGTPYPAGPPPGPPGGPPTGQYAPPPDESWFRRNRNWLIPVIAVVVIGALVGTLLVLLGDEEASADEVFLQPVASAGPDPFTESVTTATTGPVPGAVSGSHNGSEPGLYGGTRDEGACDREAMLAFLEANPEKAAAWARVQGITVDGIADFVADLTPIVLRGDTRVTNHGFRGGVATPFQAVLQAGTAVMVDRTGVPRVRCSCGNPLLPPTEARSPIYVGDPWRGWDRDLIQVVFVDVEVNVFVLVDVVTGDRFERPVGTDGTDDADEGGEPEPPPEPATTLPPETTPPPDTLPIEPPSGLGTGDVQVTATWTGSDDVDLHVTDPSGEEIYFSNPASSSGGQLDVDDIPSCEETGSHVENVFWPTGSAPSGTYSAYARNLGGCDGTAATVTVEVFVGGSLVDSQTHTIDEGSQSPAVSFTVS